MRKNRLNLTSALCTSTLTGIFFSIATPAYAQAITPPTQAASGEPCADGSLPTADHPCPAAKGQNESGNGDIVVTGSHIRDNYNSASPIQFITHDEITLSGARSTAEVLQGPSVTSGGAQINNTFLGFVTTSGPGANTVGLRGLGADRTLVLLNGRRLAPAGSGSEVGSADLNTLPLAIVDHYEVLKDGASTIYGSDAIAGVVNIITKQDQNGLTLDAYGNLPLHQGDGSSYRLSGVYGISRDRGHLEVAIDYNVQDALKRRDRGYARCPTDDLYDPQTGAFVGSTQNGQPRCLPFSYSGGQGIADDYMVAYGSDGVHRFTPNPAQVADGTNLDGFTLVDDVDLRPGASPLQYNEDIYSPVKNLTVYSDGAIDLGSGNLQLYGEALFARRLSSQTSTSQLRVRLRMVQALAARL